MMLLICQSILVASFTDAWIETKLRNMIKLRKEVASFTDAWIETFLSGWGTSSAWSHLLQMRGLKPITETRPLLKQVASFTDAWIETYQGR